MFSLDTVPPERSPQRRIVAVPRSFVDSAGMVANLELLQSILIAIAQARRVEVILPMIVTGLVDQADVALARIWLASPVTEQGTRFAQLAASAGRSTVSGTEWDRTTGEFSKIPFGKRKIGHIAQTGESLHLDEKEITRSHWTAHADWVKGEGIKGFAGHPLIFRDEILGVLGVFSRQPITDQQFRWLRLFADQASVAIANARAFEEIETLRERLEQENEYLRNEVQQNFGGLIGESAALKKVLQQIDRVAPLDVNVLVLGESGTGKELVARAIHERSKRSQRTMVKVNCASIPEALFESEFFGHVKGAFSGAVKDRAGRFQLADGGTLFLDEIAEVPLLLQSKLLRILQEGEFERLGDERTQRVNVRIIAATNRDLASEVAAGRFRQDLYFRLNVFPIEIPPLRERREDIALLAGHFLRQAAARVAVPVPRLTEENAATLTNYSWPGNIRELQNVIERSLILSGGGLLEFDLRESASAKTISSAGPSTQKGWLESQRATIEDALRRSAGKIYGKGGAAEILGIPPTTLASRIATLGIKRDGSRG